MRKKFIVLTLAAILGFALSTSFVGCKKADEAPVGDEAAQTEKAEEGKEAK